MFNSKKEVIHSQNFDVIIGSDSTIGGKIVSEGSVRIDGNITGDISAKGNVIIGATAIVDGDVDAENIEISGVINGNINARVTIKIFETGKLNGDFECASFFISEGGSFSGRCSILGNTNPDALPIDSEYIMETEETEG